MAKSNAAKKEVAPEADTANKSDLVKYYEDCLKISEKLMADLTTRGATKGELDSAKAFARFVSFMNPVKPNGDVVTYRTIGAHESKVAVNTLNKYSRHKLVYIQDLAKAGDQPAEGVREILRGYVPLAVHVKDAQAKGQWVFEKDKDGNPTKYGHVTKEYRPSEGMPDMVYRRYFAPDMQAMVPYVPKDTNDASIDTANEASGPHM